MDRQFTGQRRSSSGEVSAEGRRADIKNGAGSCPGTDALGRNPATVRSQAPCGDRRRSRGSRDRAWSSERLFPVARARRKTNLLVKNCFSWLLDQSVGSGLEAKNWRTRARSQVGTWGRVLGRARVRLRKRRDKVGWCPRGTPPTDPKTEAKDERYEAMVWGAKPRTSWRNNRKSA